MTQYTNPDKLASLITSRLCHDLANPIGAVQNGLELMELSGYPPSPELELVSASVSNAQSKIGFYRVVFGSEQRSDLSHAEIQTILKQRSDDQRCQYLWAATDTPDRASLKLLFLLGLCLESSMPLGGQIKIDGGSKIWTIVAQTERFDETRGKWAELSTPSDDIEAADIHFLIAAITLEKLSAKFQMNSTETGAEITLKV